MAEKDLSSKLLEDYSDVFADIFNVLLFQEHILEKESLRSGPTESVYKADSGESHDQRRDVFKQYEDSACMVISSYGIENQASLDPEIPIRIMSYDAATYRQQFHDGRGFSPVITIVLNMTDKQWNVPKSIHELTGVSGKFAPFVPDYSVPVFDIAYLEDSVIDSFQSDFKAVARFFKHKRLGILDKTIRTDDTLLQHPAEVTDFFAAFSGDKRYSDISLQLLNEGGKVRMCDVAEKLENEGIKKGIKEGIKEGIILGENQGMIKGKVEVYYFDMHLPAKDIAQKVNISEEEVNRIIQEQEKNR